MDIGNFYGLKRRITPGKISLGDRGTPNENEKTEMEKDDLAIVRMKFNQAQGRLKAEAVYAAERRKKHIAESQRRYVCYCYVSRHGYTQTRLKL